MIHCSERSPLQGGKKFHAMRPSQCTQWCISTMAKYHLPSVWLAGCAGRTCKNFISVSPSTSGHMPGIKP